MISGPSVAGSLPPPEGPRSRRRVALWVGVAVAVVLAVLIAVLATSGKEGQLDEHSPLLGQPAPAISGANLLAASPGQAPTAGFTGPTGHWVLVNFAASWCIPCQQEMPQLLTLATRRQAQIITVAYQPGDEPSLAAYFRQRHVTWPVIGDDQAKVAYGVTGIPESYLVDPEGRVVGFWSSGVNADRVSQLITTYTPPSGS